MISLAGLSKEYNGKAVVQNVDLHVREGEIYGFLGPNGAGKTTTILMILGLVRPTRGEVRLFGKTLRDEYFEVKRRMGVVGEFQHLYGHMTGREYLSFFAGLYGVKDGDQRTRHLLARVGLEQSADLVLKNYSKGMRQKLSLARALVHDPDLLILDEPVSSLDPCGIRQVRDIIIDENKKGKTVFISSHLLSEIEKTCHRIGILNHGTLVAEDTMTRVKERLSAGVDVEVELYGIPDGIVDTLRGLPFVESVILRQNVVTVRCRGKDDRRADISRFLTEHGCVVLGMKRSEMSLEDAFVAITEKNISLLTQKAVVG